MIHNLSVTDRFLFEVFTYFLFLLVLGNVRNAVFLVLRLRAEGMRTQVLVSPDLIYCLSSPLEFMTQKEFRMETEILKKLRHRHLITLFAVCTSSAPFYIITELMEKGNLLNFLRGLLPFN